MKMEFSLSNIYWATAIHKMPEESISPIRFDENGFARSLLQHRPQFASIFIVALHTARKTSNPIAFAAVYGPDLFVSIPGKCFNQIYGRERIGIEIYSWQRLGFSLSLSLELHETFMFFSSSSLMCNALL